jgi:RNA polymerase sigma-70 factor (ECF subfamily)
MTCSQAEAEQAVQEIFADVWRSAGTFDPDRGSEEIFIIVIARRRLINRMRRAGRPASTRVGSDIDALSWADDNCANLCAEAVAATRAVMLLRPGLRKLLELGVLQGLSHSEIARELQIPVETVKTLMRHALIRVCECWNGELQPSE